MNRVLSVLDREPSQLAAGILEFIDQPLPSDGAGLDLLDIVVACVAHEDLLADWLELARIWRWYGRTGPLTEPDPPTHRTQRVLRATRTAVSALDDTSLRANALALAPRAWLLEALAESVYNHAPDRDALIDPARPLDEHSRDNADRAEFLHSAAEHELGALTAEPPAAWGPSIRPALAIALTWRLTALAAVFAHLASEPVAPTLDWQNCAPGHWSTTLLLPGAVAPLSAAITEQSPSPHGSLGLPLAVEGPFSWAVSWGPPGRTAGQPLGSGRACSPGYARWQAHTSASIRCAGFRVGRAATGDSWSQPTQPRPSSPQQFRYGRSAWGMSLVPSPTATRPTLAASR
ncbi:hypothetical protein [Streptacidiphilus sp. PAMC 29251]